MSKQSRAKSRARRKSKGTNAVAVFEQSIRYMPEHKLFDMKYDMMNTLHHALCDRRVFKDRKYLELFNGRQWSDLEREVAMSRSTSDKIELVLELIPKAKILCIILKNEEVN